MVKYEVDECECGKGYSVVEFRSSQRMNVVVDAAHPCMEDILTRRSRAGLWPLRISTYQHWSPTYFATAILHSSSSAKMPPSSSASPTTLKRIHREIVDLKKEDLGAIKLEPFGDDLFHWTATIPGPEGSVYEGGIFNVDITLAHDYPFSAPRMTFKTRIYHMNISERGGICIDILKHNWSPALSLFKVILSLSSLLTDPNPKDPLVPSIATEYVRHRAQHDRTAREWTQLYAKPPPPPVPVPTPRPALSTPSAPVTRSSAKASSASTSAPSRNGSSSRNQEPVIEIDDSDEEHALNSRASRAQTRQTSGKRKRGSEAAGDDTVVAESSARATARRRTEGSGSSRAASSNGDIIVIED
ncbi:hypothetical protein BDW22DRAFT_1361905 [Trametopsis cervina]|nr:hypothetical protein BDW22DRAFT_1361905 [Trametopsis cervina]